MAAKKKKAAKKKTAKKKALTPMEKLTAGYEKFIKGKQINPDGKAAFEKTVKKAAKPRSSKRSQT